MDFHIAMTFGLLLGVSLMAGLFAEYFHVPKVTAYLMVGLLLGPSLFDVIHEDHVHVYEPMLQLAMAIVLFNLGCQFPLRRVKQTASRVLLLSAGEIVTTFVLVATALILIQQPVSVSVLLGALAIATAPATTVLVFKEFESEGPVTEYASSLVALNNFASIVIFEAVFLVISVQQGNLDHPLPYEVLRLLLEIVGSVLAGVLTGMFLSYICGLMSSGRWLVMLVALTTFLLGLCEMLEIPYLLTFLVMGVTVANTSDKTDKIVGELDHVTGLLCVLFFTVHGAEMDVAAFLVLGLTGAVYVVFRIIGKLLGVWAVATATGQPTEVRRWLGTSLLAQAGAAIALSTIAVQRNPELGGAVQVVILGSVVVFELIGPLLIRESVLRAGEVPIGQAIHHTSSTPTNQVREIWDQLLDSIRTRRAHDSPQDLTVSDLLRRGIKGIPQSAGFDEVLSHIEHSHDNTYPVVDREHRVVGVIRYASLSNVMFDNAVTPLVRAEDLATPTDVFLFPDDSIARARQLFQMSRDDCLPVVSRDDTEALLGVIHRRDVMRFILQQSSSN